MSLKTGVYWIASGLPVWCGRTKNDSKLSTVLEPPHDPVEPALGAHGEVDLDHAVE